MARWQADARERLVQAAVELFSCQGYDHTTVGDIAARAGLTARTYNRYFVDKREVLFGSADMIRSRIVSSLRGAAADLPPLVAALEAVSSCDDLFRLRDHRYLRIRAELISGSVELQEREAHKLAVLSGDIAAVLEQEGRSRPAATVAAELAVLVFANASRLWTEDPTSPFRGSVDRALRDVVDVVRTTSHR